MSLPSRQEAQELLEENVTDEYQRYHAGMVATAMEGYGKQLGEDADLWYITGLIHDVDFEKHPTTHPAQSLEWFKAKGYPEELIHAVEAHAYGYNGFATLPGSRLAAALLACDEMCGIFYAYKKLNSAPYGEMKASSILKKFKDKAFAAKIERETINRGCEALGVTLDAHIANLIGFLKEVK
jgi:predicted hydrolase (HD superfamily)